MASHGLQFERAMSASFSDASHPLSSESNKTILSLAARNNVRVFLVGGYIRDALLAGKLIDGKDLDYAVLGEHSSAKPSMQFAQIVANELAGHYVPLDETNDTARVVLDSGEVFDFAGCVGGSIEKDVMRRDFTINALAWDPNQPDRIIDLVGGVADLEKRLVKAVSEASITEDPLRMLRAFRFAATINGAIDAQTLELIQKHKLLMQKVAPERINYELFLMLGHEKIAELVKQLGDCGLLEVIFPEMMETRRVTANAFHHLGLFEHSIETIPQLEQKYDHVDSWVRDSAKQVLSANVSRLAATKLACILHDIGKPATWAINEEGRHSFYGHDKLGADMCEKIADRMKWSRPVEKLIVNLVRWHLRPGALFHQGPPTDKAVRRFYRSIGDDLPELMLLAFADFGATRGPGLMGENRNEQERGMFNLLHGYLPYKEESLKREKLLNGSDIMELLQLKPGRIVGELLAALDEAQEFKEVQNRDDAVRFVRSQYIEKYSK